MSKVKIFTGWMYEGDLMWEYLSPMNDVMGMGIMLLKRKKFLGKSKGKKVKIFIQEVQ